MTKFVIQGNIADVRAGLKATLDAQDANFKAQLNAAVKLAPPPQRVPMPAPVAAPPVPSMSVLSTTNRGRRFAR